MNATEIQELASATVDVLKKALAVRDGRITALEQRLAQLEAKPFVKFCGTWQRDTTYTAGDAATHHGTLWICRRSTTGEPSKDFVGWQLALKKGAAA